MPPPFIDSAVLMDCIFACVVCLYVAIMVFMVRVTTSVLLSTTLFVGCMYATEYARNNSLHESSSQIAYSGNAEPQQTP